MADDDYGDALERFNAKQRRAQMVDAGGRVSVKVSNMVEQWLAEAWREGWDAAWSIGSDRQTLVNPYGRTAP